MDRFALVLGAALVCLPDVSAARPVPMDGPFLAGIARAEAGVQGLLNQVRPHQPLVRRCLADKLRRLRRWARTARRAHSGVGTFASVSLTRAYLGAIILAEEARQCRRRVGPVSMPSDGRTRVTVEVDRNIVPMDRLDPLTW